MKTSELKVIFAAAMLAPMLAVAQNTGGSTAPANPPAAQSPQMAAVTTARDQMRKDYETMKADRKAAKEACATAGSACDAANAKVAADKSQMDNDRKTLRSAMQAAGMQSHHHGGAPGGAPSKNAPAPTGNGQ